MTLSFGLRAACCCVCRSRSTASASTGRGRCRSRPSPPIAVSNAAAIDAEERVRVGSVRSPSQHRLTRDGDHARRRAETAARGPAGGGCCRVGEFAIARRLSAPAATSTPGATCRPGRTCGPSRSPSRRASRSPRSITPSRPHRHVAVQHDQRVGAERRIAGVRRHASRAASRPARDASSSPAPPAARSVVEAGRIRPARG